MIKVFNDRNDKENKSTIIAGAGELQVELFFKRLQEFVGEKVVLKRSQPVVSLRETLGFENVNDKTMVCVSKSPNALNRIYITAQKLDENLVKDMENNSEEWLNLFKNNKKEFLQKLNEMYVDGRSDETTKIDIEIESYKKIWAMGETSDSISNLLIDQTKCVQLINEIKDLCILAFHEIINHGGVCCNENLRGVRFNIVNAKIHSDRSHRNAAQIIPAAKRAFSAALINGLSFVFFCFFFVFF